MCAICKSTDSAGHCMPYGRRAVHYVLLCLCCLMNASIFVDQASFTVFSSCCRGLHTVTAVGDKLYLFGGASQKGQMQSDLWVLDLSTMQWTQLHPKGETPHIRCSHTAVLVGQDIVFFGGSYYRYCSIGRPSGAAQVDMHMQVAYGCFPMLCWNIHKHSPSCW